MSTCELATVVLVDDDPIVRTAISRLLRAEGYTVQAFASADSFLAQRNEVEADCIVSDLAMPGLDGLQLQNALATSATPPSMVFISGHGTVASSVKAMRNGAVDFLTKPVNDVEFLRAVQSAIEEHRQVQAEFDARSVLEERLRTLTPREREVLEHVVAGQLNKQIAADLGIVEKTIKVHRARVMEKMGVTSVAELTRLSERAGISPSIRAPARTH